MPRVMFTVTYTIESDKQAEHQELMRRLKKIYAEKGLEYYVFRNKNNEFTEATIYADQDAFEESDDLMEDETTSEYINRVNALARDIRYETLHEVELD